MKVKIFTICSNNYLAQAATLGRSVLMHNPSLEFSIVLADRVQAEIDYSTLGDIEIIPASNITDELDQLAVKYNIVEFNTALKPIAFDYMFNELHYDICLYFDPDIVVYDSLSMLVDCMREYSIALTPHALTPAPEDYMYPSDNAFLKYGIYNLGYIGIKNSISSNKMLKWWKSHTLNKGFNRTNDAQFTDQLPVNLVPIYFDDVLIIKNKGCNMAPWNLHERHLLDDNMAYVLTTGERLVFYHFSDFKPGDDLKISKNDGYNRYKLDDRYDLYRLYNEYSQLLIMNKYEYYSPLKCYYYRNIKPSWAVDIKNRIKCRLVKLVEAL